MKRHRKSYTKTIEKSRNNGKELAMSSNCVNYKLVLIIVIFLFSTPAASAC